MALRDAPPGASWIIVDRLAPHGQQVFRIPADEAASPKKREATIAAFLGDADRYLTDTGYLRLYIPRRGIGEQ